MDKVCLIIRGVSGSGKSTFAKYVTGMAHGSAHHETDGLFFQNSDTYKFDADKLREYHRQNYDAFCESIEQEFPLVVVSNTSTRVWEFANYKKFAEEHGYTVFVVVMENYHGGKSDHSVPDETIEAQKLRFDINL